MSKKIIVTARTSTAAPTERAIGHRRLLTCRITVVGSVSISLPYDILARQIVVLTRAITRTRLSTFERPLLPVGSHAAVASKP
ncbi:hypothetical protein ACWDOP_01775 [Nocardia sp. NPDC003693]